jgi:sulfatase maturation enzyme AslB (radical SAM superfamily)
MINERDTAVLYTCATCNLNCRYCYIDKNPALVEIDNILAGSFEGDYYFDFLKKVFPKKSQLKRIETWGGEPFLHMDRVYGTLHKVIDYYPLFDQMHSSTNFSFPEWNQQFFGLMNQFAQYPNRTFTYHLQLSIDGPEYINDAGRGIGTTKKCLDNFNLFVEMIGNNLPPNVLLNIALKATLDKETIKMLCNKQKIIEYYQFFEKEFVDKIAGLGYSNIRIFPPVPNTASPAPYTKEDGKIFAELCRLCGEVERENETKNYFKYYRMITPYKVACGPADTKERTYKYKDFTCGTGKTVVGLLPNNYVSACHNGFVDLVSS